MIAFQLQKENLLINKFFALFKKKNLDLRFSCETNEIYHCLHLSPLLGVCDDRNYQNKSEDIPGVRPPAYLWPLRPAADPGGLPLSADVSVALCF